MPTVDGPKRRVKTADRTFEVIETVRRLEGATTAELADELSLATSTAHDYLATLEAREYLVEHDGVYDLGLRFLGHGMYAKNRSPASRLVQPTLDWLAEETTEMAWFTVEEHGRVVDLNKAAGDRALTVGTWLGERSHMHHLAAGKAILAHLPEERVREIVDRHGLPAQTERTITDLDELFAELDRVRDEGVAYNDEETTRGLRSVGAPVHHAGAVVGAISVTAPAKRLRGERYRSEIPDQILAATNEIELKLLSESDG
ncbi:IclR family transcriptional regulator [Salinigranum salinum]|uniref:IclR family transcriptional regulator n=1 Tax=Salinigranum salinum TaxID=1364937 RepID=UPI0012606BC4|nr:IclR family transcriptional regulator [Salinigranum salinum]